MILQKAGDEFDTYVLEHVLQPKSGSVYCLPAFRAPVDRILLGILPKWQDSLFEEEKLVTRCYKNLMLSCADNKIESIAIPALGAGQNTFPQRRISRIILNIFLQNMPETLQSLQIICKDESSFDVYQERLSLYESDALTTAGQIS